MNKFCIELSCFDGRCVLLSEDNITHFSISESSFFFNTDDDNFTHRIPLVLLKSIKIEVLE